MKAVIQKLSSMADVVLLDTAPAQLLADAAMMARYVDSAVYVIRYDYTKIGKIRGGIQSLSLSKIKMLGYVFNCDRAPEEAVMATAMAAMAATAVTDTTGITEDTGISERERKKKIRQEE